jgi:hypothetical protein
MIGSIERVWRRISRHSLVPVVVLVGLHSPLDPTRRISGYAGVLTVPAPSPAAATAANRSESAPDHQRKDVRAARGRVLYSDGRSSSIGAERTDQKVPCAERHLVQRGQASSSPTS